MPFGDAKKVYCIEKNEIYPSISFVKERVASNIWMAIKEPERVANGFHWRYATPEDLINGTEINPADYPKRAKGKKIIKTVTPEGEVKEEYVPIKRGWSNEEIAKWNKSKEIADTMSNYLNQLESIFTSPMSEEEKIENFNVAALYVGKLMVSFCDFCETQEIYVERGVRGGKVRGTKIEEENKEDDYEFVEEEGE
jgi:hypothetical protein